MISNHAVASFRNFMASGAWDRATRGGRSISVSDFEVQGAYDAEPVDLAKIVEQLRKAVPDKGDMEKLVSLLSEISPNAASDRRRLAADQAGAETGFYARFPEARFHKILS